jgi:mRNA-degrading endonuclease toxin of MazEF toxin-antitoxin module
MEPDRTNGLKATSWVKCEQILTLAKDRLTTLWGSISATDMERIEAATKTALAFS